MENLTILDKRFAILQQKCNIQKLHDYFNIPNTKLSLININTLNIYIYYEENRDVIEFLKKTKCIGNLPIELINEIIEYIPIHRYLDIHANIDYPLEYPFRPPQWSLTNVSTNCQVNLNLSEHYQTIIKEHNRSHKYGWLPTTDMDMDILDLFTKINHFDELIMN
jgi:hypothetical protein